VIDCRRRYVGAFLGAGDAVANFVVDEILDHILLASAHDDAAHVRVVCVASRLEPPRPGEWLGPQVSRVRGVAGVFERDEVVLLVAGQVVGTRHAPGRIDLPCGWVDEFRPCLMDSVAVFPKLLSLQPARVPRRGLDELGAPLGIADIVFIDVPLRDLRVRGSRRPRGVRVDFRRADAAGLGLGRLRQKQVDHARKDGEMDWHSHLACSPEGDEDTFGEA